MKPKESNQGHCLTKQKLIEELMRNHSDIAQIGSQRFAAVVGCDWAGDLELGEKRKILEQHRQELVRHIQEHVTEHGC
jgi:hypothetical protein